MIKTDDIKTKQAVQQALRVAAETHRTARERTTSQWMKDSHLTLANKYLALVNTVLTSDEYDEKYKCNWDEGVKPRFYND